EGREVLPGKPARPIKDHLIEVRVQRHPSALELAHDALVPFIELLGLQTKLLHRLGALGLVPAVGAEHAAHVEKTVGDHFSSGANPSTRMAGRPRPRNACRSPSACAASSSPNVNFSSGIGISCSGLDVI